MAFFAEHGKINNFSGKTNKLYVNSIKNSENLRVFSPPTDQK